MIFCLNSSKVSQPLPPAAAIGLLTTTELNVSWYRPPGSVALKLTKVLLIWVIFVNVLALTLAFTPPPVKYLTVKSPVGAIP